MSGWRRINLRRVAKLGTGHTPSRQHPEYWVDCTIPWLTLADVWQLRDGTRQVISETKEKISGIGLANSSAVLHSAGTVVMSRTASVGFFCILGTEMTTSQDFATWTCGPALRPRYLLYALRGLRDEILAMRMGSTHQTIYMPDIERISIPVPPVQTQDVIADFLDIETARIDALIAKKRRIVKLFLQREQAALLQAVGTWQQGETRSLRQLGTSLVTGPFGTQLSATEYVDGEIPVVNPTHLRRGRIFPEQGVTVTGVVAKRLSRHQLSAGDLVLGRKGDVGRSAVVTTSERGWICGSDSIAVRVNRDKLLPEYLSVALRIDLYRQQLAAKSTGSTLANVNESTLKSFKVPAIDIKRQSEAVSSARKIISQGERVTGILEQQVGLLQEHRQALITAAVTGELAVSGRPEC